MKKILIFLFFFAIHDNSFANETKKEILSEYFLFHSFNKLNALQFDSAAFYLHLSVKTDPHNDVAQFYYSRALELLNYTKESLESARKAYESDTTNYWYLVNYAKKVYISKDTTLLKHTYNKLFRLKPDDQQHYLDYALYSAELGNYDEALRTIKISNKKFGINLQTVNILKNIYAAAGNAEEALRTLYNYIKTQDTLLIERYFELFELAVYFQRDTIAEFALKKASEIDPQNLMLLLIETDIAISQMKYDLVMLNLNKAFRHPEVTQAIYHKYLLLIFNHPSLVKKYSTSIKNLLLLYNQLFPSISSRYFDAQYYYLDKALDSSFEVLSQNILYTKKIFQTFDTLATPEARVQQFVFTHSLEEYEAACNSFFLFLDILHKRKNYREIIDMTLEMLEIFPSYKNKILLLRGYAHFSLGEYNLAKQDFHSLRILYDRKLTSALDTTFYFQIYSSLAEIAVAEKNKKEMKKYYTKLLKFFPNENLVMNNYAYHLSLLDTDLKIAKKYILKVLETESENPIYLDTYAVILFKLKRYKEAQTVFRKALTFGGKEEPEILENYGDLLYVLKDYVNTEIYWNLAFKISNKPSLKKKIEELNPTALQ